MGLKKVTTKNIFVCLFVLPELSTYQIYNKMECKEQDYSLIVEIKAYPEDAVSFSQPMQYEKKHIDASFYSADETRSIKVPIKKLSGKLSETVKHERAGKTYTVTIDWESNVEKKEDYQLLHLLEDNVNHLEIKTFGDNLSFVRSQAPGYKFTMEEDAGTMKCSLSIINKAGVQRVL